MVTRVGISGGSRRVLIVAYVFPPIAYAGTHRTLRFCRYLPANGWLPTVLTIAEGEDLDNDPALLKRVPPEVGIYRTMTFDPYRTYRQRLTRMRRTGVPAGSAPRAAVPIGGTGDRGAGLIRKLKKLGIPFVTTPDHMVFWIPFALGAGVRIARREKPDVIYTSSPPHSEHLIGLALAKLLRRPWVADFRDPILDSSGYSPGRFQARVDAGLERLVVKHADTVLIISDDYRTKVCRRYPEWQDKLVTLPNGFDPELFERTSAEPYKRFTILYAGSFYANRRPGLFLLGFSRWIHAQGDAVKNDVQVEIYGPDFAEAREIVAEEGLEAWVRFGGMVPQDEVIRRQKGAHLLLLVIGFDPESRGTVTSKVFEYMACGHPILAIMPEGEAAAILESYSPLYWVREDDADAVATSLALAYEAYRHRDGAQAPELDVSRADSPYDARAQTQRLAAIFESLVAPRSVVVL